MKGLLATCVLITLAMPGASQSRATGDVTPFLGKWFKVGKWQKENPETTEDLEVSTLTITQKGKEAKAAEEVQSFTFTEASGGPTKAIRKSDLRDLQVDDGELHYSCTNKGNKSEGVLAIRDGFLFASGCLEGTYSQNPEEFQAAVQEFTARHPKARRGWAIFAAVMEGVAMAADAAAASQSATVDASNSARPIFDAVMQGVVLATDIAIEIDASRQAAVEEAVPTTAAEPTPTPSVPPPGTVPAPQIDPALGPESQPDSQAAAADTRESGLLGSLQKGQTENQVLAIMEQPLRVSFLGGVKKLYEYRTGTVTFADGELSEVEVTKVGGIVPPPESEPPAEVERSAPVPPPGRTRPSPPARGVISVGMTESQVVAALGQPLRVSFLGGLQKMYEYRDRKIVFTDGSVSEVQ